APATLTGVRALSTWPCLASGAGSVKSWAAGSTDGACPLRRTRKTAMPSSRCPAPAQLTAFSVGRLEGSELDGVADHVVSCTHCQTALQHLAGQPDRLLAALRQGMPPDPFAQEALCRQGVAQAQALLQVPQERLGEYVILENLRH